MKGVRTLLSSDLKREFQKDLELFKHFLLLLNAASPIRNVELMWHEEGEELDPLKMHFKSRIGTGDALVQLRSSAGEHGMRNPPSTLFCDLVHGFGAHEKETCTCSDDRAKKRCRLTGKTQVYSCHVGLTDIAVPIICDGEYLGTLFSGQVLTKPPSVEGFRFVRENLVDRSHIDFTSLEDAYYQVPVVTEAEVGDMVRILELFARYIAGSWKRSQLISEMQRNRERDLNLNRKELASFLLSGDVGDPWELKALTARAGLQFLPDQVLVVQISYLSWYFADRNCQELLSLSRLSHMTEVFCQTLPNTVAATVRPGEICVFTGHVTRNEGHHRIVLKEMAESILSMIRSRAGAMARIGISEKHPNPAELLKAFHEACSALDSSSQKISFFTESEARRHPSEVLLQLIKAFHQGTGVVPTVREFLALSMPADHSASETQKSRALLTWAIEHLALELANVGASSQEIKEAKQHAITGVLYAPTYFGSSEAFRKFADVISCHMTSAFSERDKKIVLAVSRLVQEHGAARTTIQHLAGALRVSSGHLSRVFRRTTGVTLERFLILQRLELAKTALLDPRLNVAEVAERSGFRNSAYFASVFKKYMHCTPREFASQPYRWEPSDQVPLVSRPAGIAAS